MKRCDFFKMTAVVLSILVVGGCIPANQFPTQKVLGQPNSPTEISTAGARFPSATVLPLPTITAMALTPTATAQFPTQKVVGQPNSPTEMSTVSARFPSATVLPLPTATAMALTPTATVPLADLLGKDTYFSQVVVSPVSDLIAATRGRGIVIYAAETLQAKLTLIGPTTTQGYLTAVTWSPNREFLAAGDNQGNVWIWQPLTAQSFHLLKQYLGSIVFLAWSPDSSRLALTVGPSNCVNCDSNSQNRTTVFDMKTDKEVWSVPYRTMNLIWSPDSKHLAFGDTQITLRNAENGHEESSWFVGTSNRSNVGSMSWSSDGRWLAVGKTYIPGELETEDNMKFSVRIWDITSQQKAYTPDIHCSQTSVAWSPDNKYLLIVGSNGSIYFWQPDIHTIKALWSDISVAWTAAAWLSDNQRVVLLDSDGRIALFDTITLKFLAEVR
jgi:WD40 repeat protein